MKNLFIISFFVCICVSLFAQGSIGVFKDSAAPIEICAGQEFSIALKAPCEQGYKWEFSKMLDSKVVKQIGSSKSGSCAAGDSEEIINFQAVGQGTTMISLKYARPGERDMYPLDSKTFIVVVK